MIKISVLKPLATKNLPAVAIGVVGYAIADILKFPAPALTGPALFVSLAALLGAKLEIHSFIQNSVFLLIGVAMGSSVTPEVIVAAKRWPVSFLVLAVNVICIFYLCRHLLERFWPVDRATATLASTPGHMSYILSLSLNSTANIGVVSVIQSIRVLWLTLAVPLIITVLGYEIPEADISKPILPSTTLMLILVGSFVCALIFRRINLAAAYLLAGMFVSSITFVTGNASGEISEAIYLPVIIMMGTIIGTRLSGIGLPVLKEAAGSGFVLVIVAIIFSSLTALAYSIWSGLSFGLLLIAFAPGGLETMIAMSLILGTDPAFVAAHHVWRLIVLTVLAPIMLSKS